MKVEAIELKIGNWVNETIVDLENGGCKLNEIQVDGNRIKCIEAGDVVRGIPLSEKWLLYFGFVFNERSLSYRVFSHKKEWILAAQQTMDKTMFKIGLPVDGRQDQFMTCFVYVHEIQNLYFALTGRELKAQLSEPKVEEGTESVAQAKNIA